ncbi:MAG: hypothetical protein K6E18_07910 [Lachnospiraceae bacterium]|nr:hypothetical protein [Lachnospiraceae bacterium]
MIMISLICLVLTGTARPVAASEPSLKLVQTILYAEQGKTYNLQPDGVPAAGLTWSSSDAQVAAVAGGVVTAKKPGYAEITVSDASDPAKKATCQVVVKPKQIKGLSQGKTKKDRIAISWKEAKSCDGYHIYYKEKESGTYILAGETKKTKAVLKKLSPETGYDVRIAAFVNTPLGKVDGADALRVRMFTAPNAPKGTRITGVTKGKFSFYRGQKIRFFNVEWKKAKGANAYRVYCVSGKNKPQLVDTVKKPKASLYAALGYTYKIYVVPCRTVHGITTEGKKSAAVVVDIGR